MWRILSHMVAYWDRWPSGDLMKQTEVEIREERERRRGGVRWPLTDVLPLGERER